MNHAVVKKTAVQTDGFDVWRKISLHTKPSWPTLDDMGVGFLGQGFELYRRTPNLPEQTELDLVLTRVSDFGFDTEVSYRRFCTAVMKCGLQLCPPLVGPALRMVYKDQPRGQWLYIGMEGLQLPPVHEDLEDEDDPEYIPPHTTEIFAVVCGGDGRLWLNSSMASARRRRHPSDRFVFVKPRK